MGVGEQFDEELDCFHEKFFIPRVRENNGVAITFTENLFVAGQPSSVISDQKTALHVPTLYSPQRGDLLRGGH
eukprot:6752339-Karenia_brevis.AAC.1